MLCNDGDNTCPTKIRIAGQASGRVKNAVKKASPFPALANFQPIIMWLHSIYSTLFARNVIQ